MFRTRVITVAILLPLFIGGMFYLPAVWWAAGLLPLLVAGAWEWGALAGFGHTRRWSFCAAVLCSAFALLLAMRHFQVLAAEQAAYWVSAVFWLICAPLWLWRGWHPRNPLVLALTGWVLVVPTWLALVRLQGMPWVLVAVLGVVWVADSAAYFAGHAWGRRKLAPAISPGKTWEGVAGAAAAVAVYHACVWYFGFRGVAPDSGIAAAALVAVLFPLSIMGDLFESLNKRQAGVKDSGTLLPGHGGVLDRIDALTSTLPLAALAVPWMLQRA